MKKLFKILFAFILMFITVFTHDVNASSIPYGWKSNGQQINGAYTNGTAEVLKNGYTVTLILNNYHGGSLVEECYGTGVSGVTFNIVLIGNNTITDLSSTGITLNYPETKINFSGDGDLTINALKPISYEDYTDYLYINPSKNIYTNEKNLVEEKPNTSDESITADEHKNEDMVSENDSESVTEEKEEKTDYTFIIMCVLIGYIIVSMTMFIVLLGKINKLKTDN